MNSVLTLTATPSSVHVDRAFCLAQHPTNDVLYLAALDEGGQVIALRQSHGTDFEIIDRATVDGASGICRIQVDASGRRLDVAGYLSGTVSTLPLHATGRFDGASQGVAALFGSGPDPERQDHPYIHDVANTEHGILAADLGADLIRTIRIDDTGMQQASVLACPPGSGPRHIAALGDGLIAISGELDSTLVLARVSGGASAVLDAVPATATSTSTSTRNYPSNVVADPARSIVYMANRGADTILTAAVDRSRGTLRVLAETPSGGKRPEHIARAGDHLLVVHSDDGCVSALPMKDGVPNGEVAASVTIPGAIWIEPLAHGIRDL